MSDNHNEYPSFHPGGKPANNVRPIKSAVISKPTATAATAAPAAPKAEVKPADDVRPANTDKLAKNRKPIIIAIVVVLVLGIGAAITTAVVLNSQKTVIDIPLPTAKIDAVAFKEDDSPFLKAMPPKVLEFALQNIAVDESLDDYLPIESYTLTYSDKVIADIKSVPVDAVKIDVTAAQFNTANIASDTYKKLAAKNKNLEVISEGEVSVGGKFAGNFTIVKNATKTDANGSTQSIATAYWVNGDCLFVADGYADRLVDFYKAFSF